MSSASLVRRLIRVNPVSEIDLNGISATGTNLTGNSNPVSGETHLISGTLSRINTKAQLQLLMLINDQSPIEFMFNSNIMPITATIVTVIASGVLITEDRIDPEIGVNNSVLIDISGNPGVNSIALSLWIDGYDDFREYI